MSKNSKKHIHVLTDEEIAKIENDPNYVGDGSVKHACVAKFKGLAVTCVYHGDSTNALAPDNHHRHAIKIQWLDKKTSCVVPYWPPEAQGKITTVKQVLIALYKILNASLVGALDPLDFCRVMGLNPEVMRAEVTYNFYKETFDQITKIMSTMRVEYIILELRKTGISEK